MNCFGVRLVLLLIISIFIVPTFSGCSTKVSSSSFDDASHFSFPNSNVTPIGPASATVEGDEEEFNSGKLLKKALQEAIDSKGGDIMIDYISKSLVENYSMCILPIQWKYYYVTVEGTVAKMDIGKQFLQ